jgi:hypothetical protein
MDATKAELLKDYEKAVAELTELEKGTYRQTVRNGKGDMVAIARSAVKQRIAGIKLRLERLDQ